MCVCNTEGPRTQDVESRDPTGAVQGEPGSETGEAERNGCITLESADGRAAGTCRDVQDKVESMGTCRDPSIEGEKLSALAHKRSTATDEENDQHDKTNVDDIPEDTPASSPPPDRPPNTEIKPQSVELEGERLLVGDPSCDIGRTSNKMEALGVSQGRRGPYKSSEEAMERVRTSSRRVEAQG
jgi:hypothetical protein